MVYCSDMGKHSSFSDPEIALDTFGEVAAQQSKTLAGKESEEFLNDSLS